MSAAHKRKAFKQAVDNRELSWIGFNRRVQAEADNPDNPLLERAKFLSIVASNMDEFFQVRYVKVFEAAHGKDADEKVQGGLTAQKLYRRVNKRLLRQCNMQYLLYEGIRSELYLEGVQLYPTFVLDEDHIAREKALFDKEIRPYLKVEDLFSCRPKQKQLYLCIKLAHPRRKNAQFKLIALPTALPRLFDLSRNKDVQNLIRVEDIVKQFVHRLFPKEEVEHAAVFRILRNQNFEVSENTEDDVVPAVREMLTKRVGGAVMRLEAEERMSAEMLNLLMERFELEEEQRYRVTGPLDLNKMLMSLYGMVKRSDLKYPAAQPAELTQLLGDDVFDCIDGRDWLMYHPYHTFAPVVHLMERAAVDPTVRAIRQTLYRVSGNSPIVAALAKAAENGKEVQVLFEAHARFDEESNLYWGERLTRAGCRVQYGLPNLKVHSKITLFEREVDGEVRRELHLGTGNYHDGTAKLYTDFGLLTADEQLTRDAVAFFRMLEGDQTQQMDELVKAPDAMKPTLLSLIEREKQNALDGKPARILAKMNSLSEKKVLRALCEASQAGVKIDLIVRGICCLLPGVEGVSDNIRIRSIVGRNLEHARAFLFENGGEHEVYLASADWMPRNLDKRVELMFPVKDEACRQAVENVLTLQWNDTEKARLRLPDGDDDWQPLHDGGVNAQELLLADVEGVFAGKYTGTAVPCCCQAEEAQEPDPCCSETEEAQEPDPCCCQAEEAQEPVPCCSETEEAQE